MSIGADKAKELGLKLETFGDRCPNNWHCKDNHTCWKPLDNRGQSHDDNEDTYLHRKLTPEELEADLAAHYTVRMYVAEDVEALLERIG